MQNGGQTCISVERVYVEEPVYDEFVAKVAEKVRASCARARPGDPGSVDVGAVTSPPQMDMIDSHVERRRGQGREGRRRRHKRAQGPGDFYEPTVLLDVDHTMECMTRGDLRADAADHEGRRTPRRRCGWPTTPRTASRPRCGPRTSPGASGSPAGSRPACANVNEPRSTTWRSSCRWAAGRTSGLGSRHGADGIRKYARKQSSVVTRFGPKRELFMFPYKRSTTKLIGGVLQAGARPRQARGAVTARRAASDARSHPASSGHGRCSIT